MITTTTIDQQEYTVVIHGNRNLKLAPWTIYVNQVNNDRCGNYVYSIGNATTFLVESTLNNIEQLAGYLQKKVNKPLYLSISGDIPNLVQTYKVLVDLIDKV